MKSTLKIIFVLLFLFLLGTQYGIAGPKRELRAVWIATVGNIDWPSKSGLSSDQQKAEFVRKLDMLQQLGFNTVIVQVRPAADAFYESSYEPWSRYLSGKQGTAPFPYYDPLKFMIQETHKRNMDFHAWFNPYRALVSSKSNPNPSDHPTKRNPDWIIHFDGKGYFDPGSPEAREYILKVMLEVVKKYDIDALHIDDYFYPYPIRGKEFGDQASYARLGGGLSKADWRRKNVNTFIAQLSTNIKKVKPHVKFGVSPFGIWRNQTTDPTGSLTNGTSCYDDLYSDVRLWMKNKWVDYMAPQLYWERGHRVANFSELLPWWNDNKGERELYIGLGLYKMVGANAGVWNGPNEILGQIKDARIRKVEGLVFYSLVSFEKIPYAIRDSLKTDAYFGTISIPHAMSWIDNAAPNAPQVLLKPASGKVAINWTVINPSKEPLKFLVYRFKKGEKMDIGNASKILTITKDNQYIDHTAGAEKYTYLVTALDRNWNESVPSNLVEN